MSGGYVLDLCSMSEEDTILLNQMYGRYKREYVRMLDWLSKWKNTVYWWATPLSARNWYLSEALKNICIALVGIIRLQENSQIRKIYCPSKEIAETIEKYCKKIKRRVDFESKKGNEDVTIYKQIFIFAHLIKNEIDRYKKINKALKRGKTHYPEQNEEITLIDTYIKESEVCEGYEEQYFRKILDYTKENIYFLPDIFQNTNIPINMLVKKILESPRYKYIFREQFLQISDYYKLFLYPFFCMAFCLPRKYINKVDVTSIVNLDLCKGITSGNAINGMLKYFTIKRMKAQGIKIGRLIGWYEGQPSSNGLFLAYRKEYPKGKSIGYIGYAIDNNSINVAPSKVQMRHKAVPQEMAVMAECFKQIPKQFVPYINVMIVPALRLQKAFQCIDSQKKDGKRILVALPIERKTSRAILQWIKGLENYCRENGIEIFIKNHPCNVGLTLRQYGIQELICDYQFVSGEFSKAVGEADIVITMQSNAGYETALYGKPIIFLNLPSQLNMNYMPKEWKEQRYKVVYDIEELKAAINDFLNVKLEKINLDNEKFHVSASVEKVSRLFQ